MKKLSVLFLCVAVFISCNREKRLNEYGYVIQESTGQNQYLIMDGRKVPIKNLVADGSNRVALKSLQALKWNVLYPNAHGDKIFLRGDYDDQSHSFRLSHWYIKVPFERLVVEDETDIPHNMYRVAGSSLERTDFATSNDFNPNDPAFDPRSFQQAR